jgi:DNA-binding CsgD family transcriptional regulator
VLRGGELAGRLEVWVDGGRAVVVLEGSSVTIGTAATNGVVLDRDATVSRLHAVLEELSGGWCIRDLGSRNGTHVNGQRLFTTKHLHDGDEIRVGATRLVYRGNGELDRAPTTEAPQELPDLTARERDVLMALCRPLLAGDVFTVPATIREIAEELTVTEAAVKQHLARLTEKFGVAERGERRRAALANVAIERGAVQLGDLAESAD